MPTSPLKTIAETHTHEHQATVLSEVSSETKITLVKCSWVCATEEDYFRYLPMDYPSMAVPQLRSRQLNSSLSSQSRAVLTHVLLSKQRTKKTRFKAQLDRKR